MRAIADGQLEATKAFADEMYFCLGCLACMTACPAGVNYAELFEHARAEAEASGVLNNPKRNAIRAFSVGWLFMDLNRLKVLGFAMRLYQQLGLQWLVRNSGVMKLMPKRLGELEAMTPDIQPALSSDLIEPVTPARGPQRYRVAMLTGCAQDLIFSDVNVDTVEVLARNGCEVVTPPEQHCCGSCTRTTANGNSPNASPAGTSTSSPPSSTPSSPTPAAAAPTSSTTPSSSKATSSMKRALTNGTRR